VALNSQLAERRRKLHAAVAGAIEEQKAGQLDAQAALISHHWEQAGEPLQAARWAARAAAWTARRDPTEGVRLWQLVLALARQVGESEAAERLRMDACRAILLGGSWRVGMPMEEMEALHDEGKRLAEARGDRDYLASLAVAYVSFFGSVRGAVARYASEARRALPLVEQQGNPEILSVLLIMLGYSHFLSGRLEDSFVYAQRCLALTETNPTLGKATIGFSAYLWARMNLASLEAQRDGDVQHGVRSLDAVMRAAREAGETEVLHWAAGTQVDMLIMFAGELGDSPALAREGLAASERSGSAFSQVHLLTRGMARVQLFQGDHESAIGSLERALTILRERHAASEVEPVTLALLARAHLAAGEVARAAAVAAEALSVARENGSHWAEVQALEARSYALLAGDVAEHAAEVDTLVERMAALIEEAGLRLYLPRLVELRAAVAGARGDAAARDRHLREAHRLYTQAGATGHAQRLAKELPGPASS
jgi:adenylate cyclase